MNKKISLLFAPFVLFSRVCCNNQQLSEADAFSKYLGEEGMKLSLRETNQTTTKGIPGSTYNETVKRHYWYEYTNGNLVFNTFRHYSFSGNTSLLPYGFVAKLTFKLGNANEGVVFSSRYEGYSIDGQYSFSDKGELIFPSNLGEKSYDRVLTDLNFQLQYTNFSVLDYTVKTPDGEDVSSIYHTGEILLEDLNNAIHEDFCEGKLKEYNISPQYIFLGN